MITRSLEMEVNNGSRETNNDIALLREPVIESRGAKA